MKWTLMIALVMMPALAHASPMTYTPRNPAISPGANPLNEGAISSRAALTKPKNGSSNNSFPKLSEADILKQSVLNGLSQTYQALLTGSTSGSGIVNFGDGSTAEYTTAGGIRTITFHNLDGTTTTISFPI